MWDATTIGTAIGATTGVFGAICLTLNKVGILSIGRPSSNGNGKNGKDLSNCLKELDMKFTELKLSQLEMSDLIKGHSEKLDKLSEQVSYIKGVLEHLKP